MKTIKRSKEQAVAEMARWLENESPWKVAPTRCEFLYWTPLLWGDTKDKLILVEFELPDGFHSVGITGPFTHALEGLTWEVLERMKPTPRNRRLCNLFIGWYHCDQSRRLDQSDQKSARRLRPAELSQHFSTQESVGLSRFETIHWPQALQHTWGTTFPGKACRVSYLQEPEVVQAAGKTHVLGPVEIEVDRTHLDGTGLGDENIRIRCLLACLAEQKNGDFSIHSWSQLHPSSFAIPEFSLYSWMGTLWGPFELRGPVGTVNFKDY